MKTLLVFGLAALIPSACGSSAAPPNDGGSPSIVITSPGPGATISTATSTYVPVVFEATNFNLMVPGSCGAVNDRCGHVHVLVDGTACNAGEPSNNSFPPAGSATSPATAIAQLALCPAVAGAHTIRLELHRDDHSPVSNAAAATVDIDAS